MSYVIKGKLCGRVAPDLVEPLADATVKFYRIRDDQPAENDRKADTDPLHNLLSDEAVQEKRYTLVAQARTGDQGEFVVDLNSKTIFGHQGSTHIYAGEPLEVDVCCGHVPGRKPDAEQCLVQFTAAQLRPRWERAGEDETTNLELDVPLQVWREVRREMDAWVLSGRVVRGDAGEPVERATVYAYDADLRQDDHLGKAATDAEGCFRIDYDSVAFRRTPARGANYEHGGPDVYFRVESPDGEVLLDEGKQRGSSSDRADVDSCFFVELKV